MHCLSTQGVGEITEDGKNRAEQTGWFTRCKLRAAKKARPSDAQEGSKLDHLVSNTTVRCLPWLVLEPCAAAEELLAGRSHTRHQSRLWLRLNDGYPNAGRGVHGRTRMNVRLAVRTHHLPFRALPRTCSIGSIRNVHVEQTTHTRWLP